MSTLVSPRSSATSTPCSAIGWHSGIRSGVRLAPMMPAIRATASASPLGSASRRSSEITSAVVWTVPGGEARPYGHVLAGDVDHARRAGRVDMGESDPLCPRG